MKTVQIQMTADLLKLILKEVDNMKRLDSSLSDTIVFNVIGYTDTHLGNDRFGAELKSGYSECDGKAIILK